MTFVELLLLALSLAMDCFAVSCSTGIEQPCLKFKNVFLFAFFFGLFQGGMPILGWLSGEIVVNYISRFANWVSFVILAFIGGKMIWESIHGSEDAQKNDMAKFGTVILLSIATSIDALAVGFSFSMMQTINIWSAALVIGLVSLFISLFGFFLAKKLSKHIPSNIATIIGGIVLIGIGLKILLKV